MSEIASETKTETKTEIPNKKVLEKKTIRKPTRHRRRKNKTEKELENKLEKESKEKQPLTLRDKLREKLKAFSVARTAKLVRDTRLEDLEEQLDRTKNKEEKQRIEKEIALLEDIRNKEEDHTGEFPDYGDTASYGGGQERPD